eukprot:3156819-Amphidinium_carterae.1
MEATRVVEIALHALLQRFLFGSWTIATPDASAPLASLVKELVDQVTACERRNQKETSWTVWFLAFVLGAICGSAVTAALNRKSRSRGEARGQYPTTPSSRRPIES